MADMFVITDLAGNTLSSSNNQGVGTKLIGAGMKGMVENVNFLNGPSHMIDGQFEVLKNYGGRLFGRLKLGNVIVRATATDRSATNNSYNSWNLETDVRGIMHQLEANFGSTLNLTKDKLAGFEAVLDAQILTSHNEMEHRKTASSQTGSRN